MTNGTEGSDADLNIISDQTVADVNFGNQAEQTYNRAHRNRPFELDASNVLTRLRNFAKNTLHYKERWVVCCKELNKKEKYIKTNCPTRWNSMYDMMNIAYDYKDVSLLYTQKYLMPLHENDTNYTHYGDPSNSRCPISDEKDFEGMKIIRELLKPFYDLTNLGSRNDCSVSGWRDILRVLEKIFQKYKGGEFETSTMTFNKENSKYIIVCATAALKILKKYHDYAEEAQDLMLAEFFNPVQLKLEFLSPGSEWFKEN